MTMTAGAVLIAMIILVLVGIPVAYTIGISGILFVINNGLSLNLIPQRMIQGMDSFPLLAIPLFILVGNLMSGSGISKRLVDWIDSLVGGARGGIGIVMVLSCAVFAALTGSGPATVAAIGGILIPEMVERGYKSEEASGLSAAAGGLGPIIPPSIPMIVYGTTMGVSIPAMFMGGILPGLLIVGLLIAAHYFVIRNNTEIKTNPQKFNIRIFLRKTYEALGAIFLPIIILGGIYGGIFTPTEAAAVGVVYALFVGMFVYKELKVSDLPKLLVDSIVVSAMVNIIIAFASLLSYIMSYTNFGASVSAVLTQFINSQTSYLIVLTVFLIIVGALMDNVAATIILAPILVPIGYSFGLGELHLANLFTIILVVGFVTPPFGYNLFTATAVAGISFNRVVKGAMPYIIVLIISLFILAFVPSIITILPEALGMI